jgi:serine/threonine-protein kinase
MSQRFIRCAHCGLPHDAIQAICPSTGKATSAFRKPAAPTPSRDLVGQTVGGKYAIRGVLGGGGMGTVFEAEHLTIGRTVALKVLHPKHAQKKEIVRRFYREARAAGRIGHPNVCDVYDLDSLDDGSPYLVMEKLVGETLARRMAAEVRLPLYELVDVLIQVLSALSAAHDKGIVHRDIKPENIFLARHAGGPNQAKLLDFGVSKITGGWAGEANDDLDLTRKGMVMGTPHYMSPEQARGDRDLDARVDLYACGVILYQALTGQRPFVAANNRAVLHEVLTAAPRPARELRPALPHTLDVILTRAMARNREDRYRSAADFRCELQSVRGTYPDVRLEGEQPRRLARCARGSMSPSPDLKAPPDESPTCIWTARSRSAVVDDAAPTRMMRRPLQLDTDDENETIFCRRRPEPIPQQSGLRRHEAVGRNGGRR